MDENHLSSMFRTVGYFVRRKIGCGSLNQAAAAFCVCTPFLGGQPELGLDEHRQPKPQPFPPQQGTPG